MLGRVPRLLPVLRAGKREHPGLRLDPRPGPDPGRQPSQLLPTLDVSIRLRVQRLPR